jgi:hypothetical protein
MLEKVKELALEKFAGDQELADRFVAGFVSHIAMEKEAADALVKEAAGGGQQRQPDYAHSLANSVTENVGRHLGGLAVNLPVSAAIASFRFVTDEMRHTRFLRSLAEAISRSDILKQAPKAKVERYADTIYKFAPQVAEDPNLLQSVLTNAVHGDGIDLMTIKSLTDLQARYRENGTVSPKNYV